MSGPRLNRRLILEAPERTPDGMGGYAITWQPLGEVWAEIKPGTGREKAGIAVSLSQVPVRITLRAAPVGQTNRPKPDQRFREGGRIFVILAVTEPDMSGRYLTCNAIEEEAA